jgi:transposase InsO family protein
VIFGWIEAEKATVPVQALCRTLGVSRSGYYAWSRRTPSARATQDQELGQALRMAHAESGGTYGSPRLHRAVRARGHRVGRNRVVRLMRRLDLTAARPRRFQLTTDSQHGHPIAPNRLARQFAVQRPNQVWAADLTYIDTLEGWLYLAVVLDLYARRVVGWATRPTLATDLPLAALHLALGRRQPPRGVLHHSDRGVQYASDAYQQVLTAHGFDCSMSRRGNCYDNAVVESFFSSLKQELGVTRWPSRAAAHRAIEHYIDRFYNPVRLHSTLDYQSPMEFERAG